MGCVGRGEGEGSRGVGLWCSAVQILFQCKKDAALQ